MNFVSRPCIRHKTWRPRRTVSRSPEDHIKAFKAARANRHRLIGCYHSHPNGRAEPSAADRAGAGEEDFLWLIAADDRLEAFVYRRGEFSGADLAGEAW